MTMRDITVLAAQIAAKGQFQGTIDWDAVSGDLITQAFAKLAVSNIGDIRAIHATLWQSLQFLPVVGSIQSNPVRLHLH